MLGLILCVRMLLLYLVTVERFEHLILTAVPLAIRKVNNEGNRAYYNTGTVHCADQCSLESLTTIVL